MSSSGFADSIGLRFSQSNLEKTMSRNKRVPTDTVQDFGHNPFAGLSAEGLPPGSEIPVSPQTEAIAPKKKSRGRVDIIRQTAHRGGKTVTVIQGFVGIGLPEKEKLAKRMQRVCGTGGTVKEGRIEIQGDRRTEVAQILTEAGFRPVLAGG
jgi:translation initiation factor 1